ncbi:uncharacterized protein N7483_012893 [Penicillium malachiteum]|uniref:uncharacterized protein n=1 Tax=Penicillium malachiteum TaxID=1324776 RepID=UPI0025486DBC|nr:uncharacterized protein N7483_012893 [Penicillium malachiteum]KAJ5715712.1 hypothetical protein N7483_012893 [Penicillium malachiteum]
MANLLLKTGKPGWNSVLRASEYVMALVAGDSGLTGKDSLSLFTTEEERIDKLLRAFEKPGIKSQFAEFQSKTPDLEILATICYASIPCWKKAGLRWIRVPAMETVTLTDDDVEHVNLRVLGVLARDNQTNTYYIVLRGTDPDLRSGELLISTGPYSKGNVLNLNNEDQMPLNKMFNLSGVDGDFGEVRASLANFTNAQIYYKDANGKTELLLDSLNTQFEKVVNLIPENSNVKVYAHSMGTSVGGSALMALGTCNKVFNSKEALFLGPYAAFNQKAGQIIAETFGGVINSVMHEHDFICRMNTFSGALYRSMLTDGTLGKYKSLAFIEEYMKRSAERYPYQVYGDVYAFRAMNWFTSPFFNHNTSSYRLAALKAQFESSLAEVDGTNLNEVIYKYARGPDVDLDDQALLAILLYEDHHSLIY